jgi:hypothetical protein
MLNMAKKEVAVDRRDVISLAALAVRFSRSKGMDETSFQWLRETPGRKRSDDAEPVGNSLAVLKALRSFNATNAQPIAVYKVTGHDGTNKKTLVISKADIIRLKGYILRGATERRGRQPKVVEFRVLEEMEI